MECPKCKSEVELKEKYGVVVSMCGWCGYSAPAQPKVNLFEQMEFRESVWRMLNATPTARA